MVCRNPADPGTDAGRDDGSQHDDDDKISEAPTTQIKVDGFAVKEDRAPTEGASDTEPDTVDEDFEKVTPQDMFIHPKDGFSHDRDTPHPGMRVFDCGPRLEYADYPSYFSWFTHGPLTFMSPGFIATVVEMPDKWEIDSGLTSPQYPVSSWDVLREERTSRTGRAWAMYTSQKSSTQ